MRARIGTGPVVIGAAGLLLLTVVLRPLPMPCESQLIGGNESPHVQHVYYPPKTSLPAPDRPHAVVIIGSGVAGLSAAVYSARSGLAPLVLGHHGRGQLALTTSIANYPGVLEGPTGEELVRRMEQQALQHGARIEHKAVERVEVTTWPFRVIAGGTSMWAHSVIVATGSAPRWLEAGGEADLRGKAIHTCAICDGSSYRGKHVVVVGGGDSAMLTVDLLARTSATVTLIHRRTGWRASTRAVQYIKSLANVRILTPYVVSRWVKGTTGDLVHAVVHQTGNWTEVTVPCEGAFLAIGSRPLASGVLGREVTTDPSGHIMVQAGTTHTSVDGVFAAGEASDGRYRQAITAAGSGAAAAIDADRWLSSKLAHIPRSFTPSNSTAPTLPSAGRSTRRTPAALPCQLVKEECQRRLVVTDHVVMFSKSWCPSCNVAKEIFAGAGSKVTVIELDQREDGAEVQQTLRRWTGRGTVPNIFIGGTAVGGADELVALEAQGKLKPLLRDTAPSSA